MSTSPLRERYGWLLRDYFRPELPLAAVLFTVVLVVMGLELSLPLIAGQFIDSALSGVPLSGLHRLAAAFIAAALGYGTSRVLQAYLAERLAMNTTNHLRTDLTRHCLGLDQSFHQRYRPGELVERIEGDVSALGRFLSVLLVTLAGNGLLLIGILVTLCVIAWPLGVTLTGFVVVICLVLNAMRGRATPMWAQALQADADQLGFVGEQLAATEDVRSSGAVPYVRRRFTVHARDVLHANMRASMRSAALERVVQMLFMTALATGLGLSAYLVIYHGASVAAIYLVYRYSDLLGYPIYRINNQLSDLQRATAAIGRIGELFGFRSAVPDGSWAGRLAAAPAVEFECVSYGYDADRPVLREVSFRIPGGGSLGIVGHTGGGKTTIARLLLRLADPDDGAIRVDGLDLRAMSAAQVRRAIGLVTQDVRILHLSLRDNLTFFDRTIPDRRITEVLDELGVERLLTLPGGLDTVLPAGDGGLSAGEAQMLALARVFLRDPRVVILDEATSRLDMATERFIEGAIDRLLRGRTSVVIAHRLSTIARMEEIAVIERGQVVESGPRVLLADVPASRFAAMLRLDQERISV